MQLLYSSQSEQASKLWISGWMVDVATMLGEIWGAVSEVMICGSWWVHAVLENCWSESCMNVTSVSVPDPGSLRLLHADPRVEKYASESIGMSATNNWTLGCKRDVCSRFGSWWSILQQCISKLYSSQLVLKMGVARVSVMLAEIELPCGASISMVFWSSQLEEKSCRETITNHLISRHNAVSTARTGPSTLAVTRSIMNTAAQLTRGYYSNSCSSRFIVIL